jgi:formate dehydrogenase major subunit
MKQRISRRDFLKYLGLGTAGTALLEGATAIPAFASTTEDKLPTFDLGPLKIKKAKETASVCAFCGVGCGLIVYSEGDRIIHIEGDPDNPNNEGSMCSKGIALGDANTIVDKNRKRVVNDRRIMDVLYRAPNSTKWEKKTWEWALAEIAKRVKKTRDESFEEKDAKGVTVNRTQAIAHIGSASCDNEENYLFQKMMRSLGVINFDHHARLCHSSTVTGLAQSFGRGCMTNSFTDYKNTDVFFIIGANPAETHPQIMRHLGIAVAQRGAKVIVADPRFTKTATKADIYAQHRPGTDIAFLYGMMNYAIENDLYFHDYVVNYTNASYLVSPDYALNDGVFTGLTEKDGKFSYDNKSWQYQKDGDVVKKDLSLQDPQCVFQLLKRSLSRYDIKTVSRVTGTHEDVYKKVCDLFCSTGKPDKAGNLIYAMGITQHTYGAQNVRATAMLQLLLGNIGIAGGGVNAQRGESNVQGSTDQGILYATLTGYVGAPSATAHANLKEYLEKETPKTSYWTNKPKFLISMLKAWYGAKATKENDFCFDYIPKHTGSDHSHMAIFEKMAEGSIKGYFAWGQNPAVGGPNAIAARKAMENLDWMVAVDLFETETAAFWHRPGVNPADIKTEVFLLPTAFSYEKEGTVANSSRWIQWRWKAVEPPGEAKSDLWIAYEIINAIRKEYQSGGKFPDPILNLTWNYEPRVHSEPDIVKVANEMNGYNVADGSLLDSFAKLTDTGSTACGIWIYTGYMFEDPVLKVPASQRRNRDDKSGLGLFPKWSFSWPANRRIVYNRNSTDPSGQPWDPKRMLVSWDGTQWVNNDVPDFGFKDATTGAFITPDKSAVNSFLMTTEGQGRLFAPTGMKDGPIPEHYEPVESPVKNIMGKQQYNPVAARYKGEFAKVAPVASSDFPYIATTHRLVEHYQSGAVTRNCPNLVELQPEMFASISLGLAKKIGVNPGDMVAVSSIRGEIKCRANVLPIIKPLKIDGKEIELIAMPFHWGYQGLATGSSVNEITPSVGDANTMIPESKAFLCNIKKA